MGEESLSRSTGMARFAEEVLVEGSLYTDVRVINLLRSKFNISSTGHEEDVVVLSCDADERVCDQEMGGEQDESFLMYMAVLEVFGVKIPFTYFEMDVPKFINVAPSQIRPNSWAFIRGYEILCMSFDLEPSIGPFFPFYGTKDVNKGTWISLSAHARERLFPQYASNYKKEWRDTFARVQGAPKYSTSFVLVDGKPKFPRHLTSNLVAVRGYDIDKMSDGDCKRIWLPTCRMLPLTGAQSKKYLEEVEKNKNLDGYVSSDPVGLKLRKLKRKEPPAKNDTRAGEMEVEDLEGAGDAAAFVDSPCRLL
ncbi:hypothetical protein MtrunA17_Chr5g0420781 [Medicago truncatula]|uniref:Uncharacterized protein n=1 Tax=Medicago truncatula TaxID=3880 RepID=A0A396HYA1_MEDTR|nr:hypothetical protein MtrunA17_Chr5g0420781 [Medicago truncatula]